MKNITKDYSDDRMSLCNELYDALKVRGFAVPKRDGGPDIITFICRALDSFTDDGLRAIKEDHMITNDVRVDLLDISNAFRDIVHDGHFSPDEQNALHKAYMLMLRILRHEFTEKKV